jgi:hypothetical protein
VNLLDENIRQDQGVQLREWRVPFRSLVQDMARAGTQDADIIPLLQRLKRITFFTHDRDYFQPGLSHRAYGLVWLDVFDGEAAGMIRRFLQHPDFATQARRMGLVARAHHDGVDFWRRNQAGLQRVAWPAKRRT